MWRLKDTATSAMCIQLSDLVETIHTRHLRTSDIYSLLCRSAPETRTHVCRAVYPPPSHLPAVEHQSKHNSTYTSLYNNFYVISIEHKVICLLVCALEIFILSEVCQVFRVV